MSDVTTKEGYPDKLSDHEIREEINKLKRYANGGGWRWELIIAANSMIQSGQNELADRFTKRSQKIMLALTIISAVFAGIAIYFSYSTDKTDSKWKNEEIQILEKIEKNISK